VLLVASEDLLYSRVLALLTERCIMHLFQETAPIGYPQSTSKSKNNMHHLKHPSVQSAGTEWGLRGFFSGFGGVTVLTSFHKKALYHKH